MKHTIRSVILAVLVIACAAFAQPAALEKSFSILKRTYPRVDAKRSVRAPADSAWLFRADSSSVGTVEVAFEGEEVLYMIFRRGIGGVSWKQEEINALHDWYTKSLLREGFRGELYKSALAPQINAATITRKDFDANSLLSGL